MKRSPHRTDPRITRTLKLLGDALRDLIVERGYDGLTVQDITDRANVSRTTFYLHFKDKDELLFATMRHVYDELLDDCRARLAALETLDDLERIVCDAADYDHVAQYAAFYRAMLGRHGSSAFIQQVLNYLTAEIAAVLIVPLAGDPAELPIPAEVIAAFLAGAQIGLINWWLQHDMRYTPAEMARMQYRLASGGLQGILGMIGQRSVPPTQAEDMIDDPARTDT